MKSLFIAILVSGLIAGLSACSTQRANPPSVKENVERSLDQAGFKNIKVAEDRSKGVVTLTGAVDSPQQKSDAAQVAQQVAGPVVVANEISIEPPGKQGAARKIESNLDTGIEKDYRAAIIANHLDTQNIDFHAKNGVLTLTGNVKTAQQRDAAQQIGAETPNVSQVVNELQVKSKKRRK